MFIIMLIYITKNLIHPRNKNIYSGIEMTNIKSTVNDLKFESSKKVKLSLDKGYPGLYTVSSVVRSLP